MVEMMLLSLFVTQVGAARVLFPVSPHFVVSFANLASYIHPCVDGVFA